MQLIHTVNLEFTTHCNKRCPDCCVGIGINRVMQHHTWEYFEQAAKWLYGIERVHLTGGEPTSHPKFSEYVPRIRELFGCKTLSMVTNGYRVPKYEDLIVECFDFINFSDYEDQRPALESIRKRMPVNVNHEGINGALFFPRAASGGGNPCTRASWFSNGCAYADGKFWACCVAQGINEGVGIEPQEGWQQLLMTASLPCKTCFFST